MEEFLSLWAMWSQVGFVIVFGEFLILFLGQIPGLRSLTWGSGLSLLWENLCYIIILQFEDRPAKGYLNLVIHLVSFFTLSVRRL